MTDAKPALSPDDAEARRRATATYERCGGNVHYGALVAIYRARIDTERAAGVDPVRPYGEDAAPAPSTSDGLDGCRGLLLWGLVGLAAVVCLVWFNWR